MILVWRRSFQGEPIQVLKLRLRAYATMHSAYGIVQQPSPAAGLELSPQDHAILLGILKKVEAKNATMVAVWSFIVSALVAGLSFEKDEAFQMTAALFIVAVAPFLFAAIGGTRQLDNHSQATRCCSGKESYPKVLQRELMNDLLLKEAYFAFSRTGAYVVLLVMVGLVAVNFLCFS